MISRRAFFLAAPALLAAAKCDFEPLTAATMTPTPQEDLAMAIPDGRVARWDFAEKAPPYRSSTGNRDHDLILERGAAPRRVWNSRYGGGVFLAAGSVLYVPLAKTGTLNVAGSQQTTIIAYVKRRSPSGGSGGNSVCIAGIWDETAKARQYGLFHDLPLTGGNDRAFFHVSRGGGPTPGYKFSIDGAADPRVTGLTDSIHMVGGTYGGGKALAYLDGEAKPYPKVDIPLDRLDGDEAPVVDRNPYAYAPGLNLNSKAPFRVNGASGGGLNSRNIEIYTLMVWDRALTAAEMWQVHSPAAA